MAITADQMLAEGKLITLDATRERLAATEPLAEHTFPTSSTITYEVGENWAAGAEDEPAPVFLTTSGGTRYQLTKQSVLEAGAYPGMPRKQAQFIPPGILQDYLNWSYRTGLGEREYKLLARERPDEAPLVLAMCRGTIQPFSNLALLEAVEAGVRKQYGSSEILVDAGGAKFWHDLERTNLRLVVPERVRNITHTRVEDDSWSAGVALTNSLVGISHPGTSVEGYLFRWWCTNGCTNTLASGGKLARRTVSDPQDAYEWARRSVDEVLGGLEGTFDAIQQLTQVPVGGGGTDAVRVSQVLRDLFATYRVPLREQNRISAEMAELGGTMTLYDIMQAVTRAANDDSITPRTADRLLELGGHMAHAVHDRCNACHQLLPDDFVPASLN